MPDSNANSPEFSATPPSSHDFIPQFATAEYIPPPGTERCPICANLLSQDFFLVNGQKICPSCAHQAGSAETSSAHAAFIRAILFGIGGAIVGMLLYAAVTIATGWTIGYLALAVGWIVGTAIVKGSGGIGGRRYQIAACVLTYAAISLASVVRIAYVIAHHPGKITDWAAVTRTLLLYGIASPFLAFSKSPGRGAIGLFVLFIGLRIAWTLTRARQLPITGPNRVAPR